MLDKEKILATKTIAATTATAAAVASAATLPVRNEEEKEGALKDTMALHSLKHAQVDLSKLSAQAKEAIIQSKTLIRASDIENGAAVSTLFTSGRLVDDLLLDDKKKQEAQAATEQQKAQDFKRQDDTKKEQAKVEQEEAVAMMAAVNLLQSAANTCKRAANYMARKAMQAYESVRDMASNAYHSVVDGAVKMWNSAGETISNGVTAVKEYVVDAAKTVVDGAVEYGGKAVNALMHPIDTISGLFGDEPEKAPQPQLASTPSPQRTAPPVTQKDVNALSDKAKQATQLLGERLAENSIHKIADVQDVSLPNGGSKQRSSGQQHAVPA